MKSWLNFAFSMLLGIGIYFGSTSYATESSPYALAAQQNIQLAHRAQCDKTSSELEEILCNKRIRFGVRSNYRSFGEYDGRNFKGFEVDLAKLLAARLGVQAEFVASTTTNRIEKLLEDEIDVVLATMAHTLARDSVIQFIRPHYYASPTAIVGAKSLNIHSWEDLRGKTVCVPLGNFSNIAFTQHQVRVLIYDRPDRLIDALKLGGCNLIAHDRSLLQANVTGPMASKELSARFDEKLSFNNVPWGIGIRKTAKGNLGVVLALLMADLHQSGALQNLARQHHLDINFLNEQRILWSNTQCLQDQRVSAECLIPPSNLADTPTTIAPIIGVLENSLSLITGIPLKFPMLTGKYAAQLFVSGLLVSFMLLVGSIIATLAFTLLFYRLLRSKLLLTRIAGNIVTQFFQNSPIILLLVLGYLVVIFVTPYGFTLSVLVSVMVIGLNNGANGGSAMNETAMSFKCPPPALTVAQNASIQIRAAVINAAKASPVAAFIGAPELLAVLTDITSFTGEQITTYAILSIFYLCLIQIVVVMSGRLTTRLKKDA